MNQTNDIMRATAIILIAFAILYSVAMPQSVQVNENHPDADNPGDIYLSGGVSGRWMKIERFDKHTKGFDPSFTVMFCNYMPMIKKTKQGLWQITFTSEIAKDIP